MFQLIDTTPIIQAGLTLVVFILNILFTWFRTRVREVEFDINGILGALGRNNVVINSTIHNIGGRAGYLVLFPRLKLKDDNNDYEFFAVYNGIFKPDDLKFESFEFNISDEAEEWREGKIVFEGYHTSKKGKKMIKPIEISFRRPERN